MIIVLISWFGGKEIVVGGLTTGEFTSMISYAMQILMSLMILSMILVMIMMSRASAERIVEILDEESDIKNKENPVMEIKDGSIIFDNVNFSYVKDINKLCLKNVNLEIKSGETIGIIGGTGSSKTTLVQLIPRLYDTTVGEVLVGGVNVKDYILTKLHNKIGYVPQKAVMFNGTVKENVSYGKSSKDKTNEVIEKAIEVAQAKDFVLKMDDKYDSHIASGGTNISGGQKQRLAIARAIARNPEIYIFDDSFSALDYKTDSVLRRELKKYTKDATSLIVAQRIGTIMNADKIVVLDEGECVGIGTHKELLKNCEVYKEIALSQLSEEELNNG